MLLKALYSTYKIELFRAIVQSVENKALFSILGQNAFSYAKTNPCLLHSVTTLCM